MLHRQAVSLVVTCIVCPAVGLLLLTPTSPRLVLLSERQMARIAGSNGNDQDNGSANCANVNTGQTVVTEAVCNATRLPAPGLQCVKCADTQTTFLTGGKGSKLNAGNMYNCNGVRSYAPCMGSGDNGYGVCFPWVANGNCVNGFRIYTKQ